MKIMAGEREKIIGAARKMNRRVDSMHFKYSKCEKNAQENRKTDRKRIRDSMI